MIRRPLLVLLSLVTILAGACGPLDTGKPAGGALPVVATFSVVADLVKNVGGEHVSVTTLVGPGLDTHTFTPTPADGAALADTLLIFENGADFETWLDDLYASTGSQARRVALSDGVELRAADHAEAPGAETHGVGVYDPHIWHSVENASRMVRNVRDALITADPGHKSDYEANAQAYTTELQALDAWIFEQVQTLPVDRRKLVTTHDTLAYFGARYGFEILGAVLPTSTEGASPSAQELAALVDAVRAAGVPAVFSENVSSNSLINQVATEAHVQVVASLFTDALGPEGSGAETYQDMLRYNVSTIVQALGS